MSALPAPVALMVALMGMNFFIHARYLAHRPLNGAVVGLSVLIDLAIILAAVAVWSLGAGHGFANPFFVCLYPPLLALALVFPPRLSLPWPRSPCWPTRRSRSRSAACTGSPNRRTSPSGC